MQEKQKKGKIENNKGITLIALVITIIVLIILAGVSITMLLGENGLLTKAQKAKEQVEITTVEEQRQIAMAEAAMNFKNTTYKDITIPAGFAPTKIDGEDTIEDGLVIIDSKGNEFVWVPVDGEKVKYEKKDFENSSIKISELEIDTSAYPEGITDENKQIEKYHGFYVARYEAGKEDAENEEENQVASGSKNDIIDIPLSKKGVKIWNFVSYDNMKESAKLMVNNEYVKSGLITGTQWDTIMQWYDNSDIIIDGSESDWGTYPNLNYSGEGYFYNFPLDENDQSRNYLHQWEIGKFTHTSEERHKNRYFHAAGLNNNGYRKNIADMAGNFVEFTAEQMSNNKAKKIYRGWCAYSDESVSDRSQNAGQYCYGGVSFRVVLYME